MSYCTQHVHNFALKQSQGRIEKKDYNKCAFYWSIFESSNIDSHPCLFISFHCFSLIQRRWDQRTRDLVVRHLPGMRKVPGLNPLGANILCSPSPSEETINRGPNSLIPTTHALICEELKDPGIPPKVVL